MIEHPKYEYKFLVAAAEKKGDGTWGALTYKEAVREINNLGLQGWMVRSHTFTNLKHPVTVSYVLVRKL